MAKRISSEGFDSAEGLVGLGEVFDEAVRRGKTGSEEKKPSPKNPPKKTAKKTREVSAAPISPVEGYITQLQDAFKDFPGDATQADAAHRQKVIIEFAIGAVEEIINVDKDAGPEISAAYQDFLESLKGINGLLAEGIGGPNASDRVAYVKEKVEQYIIPILNREFHPASVSSPDSQGVQESPEQKEIGRFYRTIAERLTALPKGSGLETLHSLDFEIDALSRIISDFADKHKSSASEGGKARIIAKDLAEVHFYIQECLGNGTTGLTGSWVRGIIEGRILPMVQGNSPIPAYAEDGFSVIQALRLKVEEERNRLREERQKIRQPQMPPAEAEKGSAAGDAVSAPADGPDQLGPEGQQQKRPKTEMQKFEDDVNDSPEFQAILAKLGGLQNLDAIYVTAVGKKKVRGRDILNTILRECRRFKSKAFAKLTADEKIADIEEFVEDTPDIVADELDALLLKFFPPADIEAGEGAGSVAAEVSEPIPESVPTPVEVPKLDARQEKSAAKLEKFYTRLGEALSTAEFLLTFQTLAREGALGLPAEEQRTLVSVYESLVSVNIVCRSQYFLLQPADTQRVQIELMIRGGGGDSRTTEKFKALLLKEVEELSAARRSGEAQAKAFEAIKTDIVTPPSVPEAKRSAAPAPAKEAPGKAGKKTSPAEKPTEPTAPKGAATTPEKVLTSGEALNDAGFIEYISFLSEKGTRVELLDIEEQVEKYNSIKNAARGAIKSGYELFGIKLEPGQSGFEEFEISIRRHFYEKSLNGEDAYIGEYNDALSKFSEGDRAIAVLEERVRRSLEAVNGDREKRDEAVRKAGVLERASKTTIFAGVKALWERVTTGRSVAQIREEIDRLNEAKKAPGFSGSHSDMFESEIGRLSDQIESRENYSARKEAEKLLAKGYDRGWFSSLFFLRTTARLSAVEMAKVGRAADAIQGGIINQQETILEYENAEREIRAAQRRVIETATDVGRLHAIIAAELRRQIADPDSLSFDDLLGAVKKGRSLAALTEGDDEVGGVLHDIETELFRRIQDKIPQVLDMALTQKQGAAKTLEQGLGQLLTNKDVFGVETDDELRAQVDQFFVAYIPHFDRKNKDLTQPLGQHNMKLLLLKQLQAKYGTKPLKAKTQ
jgi:hypothetical protein